MMMKDGLIRWPRSWFVLSVPLYVEKRRMNTVKSHKGNWFAFGKSDSGRCWNERIKTLLPSSSSLFLLLACGALAHSLLAGGRGAAASFVFPVMKGMVLSRCGETKKKE
jgi:hypothetical protein